MKITYFNFAVAKLVTALTLVVLFVGCNNPASSDNHDEHENAQGAVLKMNGAEIVRIEDGQVQSGQIEVSQGEETPLITIYFLAEDGDEFQPNDPDFSLRWDQIEASTAEVEQHNEDGKWSFHIHGISKGSTNIRFRLWHNDENHSDFDTPEINVIVN